MLLLLLQVFYISCFLGSLLFLAFAYVVIASRHRHHQPLSRSAVSAAARDVDDSALSATNELLPTSASSNTDELMPAHYLYLKVGLIGLFHFHEVHRGRVL